MLSCCVPFSSILFNPFWLRFSFIIGPTSFALHTVWCTDTDHIIIFFLYYIFLLLILLLFSFNAVCKWKEQRRKMVGVCIAANRVGPLGCCFFIFLRKLKKTYRPCDYHIHCCLECVLRDWIKCTHTHTLHAAHACGRR